MPIPVTFDIIETDRQLELLILKEVAKELNRRIPARLSVIDERIREATFQFIRATETYQSLVGGDLAVHFGLPRGSRRARVDTIVRAVSNAMNVEFNSISFSGGNSRGGFKIGVVTKNLSEVLSLGEGVVTTEKGQNLEWLRWLLTFGDKIIISEHYVKFIAGKGRSGGGVMVASNAGVWRVPPPYAGTTTDNWLTRAFTDSIQQYLPIIEKILEYELARI